MEFVDKAKDAENAGDYLSAIECYFQAIEIFKSMKVTKEIQVQEGKIFNQIATLYSILGNYDNAIKYYNEAIPLFLVSNEHLTDIYSSVGDCYSSIGACYLAKSQFKFALTQLKKALEFNRRLTHILEGETRDNIVKCAIFNFALSILSLFFLNTKFPEIQLHIQRAAKLWENYNIAEGFGKSLCLLFSYIIDEDIKAAYKTLKNDVESATDMPILSSTLQTILMGLILDLSAKYIPGARVLVREEKTDEKGEIFLTRQLYEDMILYGITFANRKIPRPEYKEVIALLVGSIKKDDVIISEIVPITSGTEAEVEFKDEHYEKAAMIDAKAAERNEFIVGWFHTHPGLGLFLSATDIINQLGYQSLNEKAIALVFDFNHMALQNSGLAVFRLDDTTFSSTSYHQVRWRITDAPENYFLECLALFSNFLTNLNRAILINHTNLRKQALSLAQLAEQLNRSESILEQVIPKLIELEYLPDTKYDSDAKLIFKIEKEE
ncbi:MAG TPA: hypothetical protein VMV49_11820 [Candidatus Deferrimicrobium sp.]|nr:hypothetical protein [Candidatus Deferrimicrobium sp.]